jgi:hypothetical protein
LNKFQQYLLESSNIKLYEVNPEMYEINPQFKSYRNLIKCYLGPATAELHGINNPSHDAIKDENRNAILPQFSLNIDDKIYYLGIKGCGAYEDMFSGEKLSRSSIINACRDENFLSKVQNLSTSTGFMMAESWMGESPYGCQGYVNGFDELKFSVIAKKDSINGAFICPVIAIVQLPFEIEKIARKFFWFRTYKKNFYQVIRLMPSNIRLYFESSRVVADPHSFLNLFGITDEKLMENFELNFIKSGIALLSLFARSAEMEGDNIRGIIYQDVWLDKDCVVAPDGTIHFADLEGLIWRSVSPKKFSEIQINEWEKLVFEFLFALVRLDSYRHQLREKKVNWESQRDELALLIQMALNKDLVARAEQYDNNLNIVLEVSSVPPIEIPLLEMVN